LRAGCPYPEAGPEGRREGLTIYTRITAWLLHNKILRAMTEREEAYMLRGKIQMDDAYLGGERPGGKTGRGSENKIPIVAAISLNEAGHPIYSRITAVSGFSSEAISEWAKRHLAPGSHILSDAWPASAP
jgi:hypothetical protein